MREKITVFLDQFFDKRNYKDSSWNGLQVEGKETVKKILFAVDISLECIDFAIKTGSDMIIVHHGHFWQHMDPSVSGWKKERLVKLLKHGISLYAIHLPLDRHRDVGNNAQLLKILGANITGDFCEYKGGFISYTGSFKKPKKLDEIRTILESILSAKCIVLPFGNSSVETIAVCSGGGDYSTFSEAQNLNIDLYITGDTSEIYQTAKDSSINVIFAGHHATEIPGIKALMEVIGKKFKIECEFFDCPTGL